MSILIKGRDMPESCYECAYSIERVGICSITQGGCEWGHNRPPHCPLVEIPTPHGRLIEEHYSGELQAKQPEGIFIIYRSADKDTDRFILEAEE